VLYSWKRRYDVHGLDGLRDRSHRPHIRPNATRTEVVGKIIYLRQHYHFGPAKIAMYLKRDHEVQISPRACGASPEAAPVPCEGHPDRQRARVRRQLPLARPGQGIGHVDIKPRTPRLNGKVERSHRIDAEEFYRLLDGVVIDDTKLFNDKLREWEDFYTYHRPHGSLDGQTPDERLKQRTQARV
jgi:Homeodomain-like domain/Integrase core domain